MEKSEEEKIVIVGGGICGLATALALHRKGLESIVLEKSEKLRATGACIIMQPNGWRALHQLGIASKLRQTALPIQSGHYITVKDGKHTDLPVGNGGECRCLRRSDLMKTLAEELPPNTVRLGCKVVSIKVDANTSAYSILHLHDGTMLMPRVIIGCDGVNSVVASIVGLNSSRHFSTCAIRGVTHYRTLHPFGTAFYLFDKDGVRLGLLPINHNDVYWFLTRKLTSTDSMVSKDQRLIKESTVEAIKGFPNHITEMINNSDVDSLHLTDQMRYRAPWDLLRTKFCKGTVTLAGDALHAMAPFLAQGGSASLEDAVVLARCLSQNMGIAIDPTGVKAARAALDQYAKERKMRVFWLSLETFVVGTIHDTSALLVRGLCIITLIILFRDKIANTRYDCGRL
ncbi:zeaxanthin epoxidase, chloroplastic-like isoform X2 [Gossypium australe]|uniref:Zeaxanthin epoxidase, chloroplastic-like isoform X2 n=1 Tax=Gossypium australe TaxID=47621 RepID=A0A5B6W3H5_9ROSI|nr:zeaxanthin epoxidase, chloroplastic-like isoform X2 [Gossypium australe]